MGKQHPSPTSPKTPSHRPRKYNNNNPHNKLNLNKFHQIDNKRHTTYSNVLHKKKRDIQRLIKYKKQKNQDVDVKKMEELGKIEEELEGKKKIYEKNMRKEFFIKNKYKQIMEIQMRKINKKIYELKQLTDSEQSKKQLQQWQKKQRYIKFYPKNLKYVSLFPSTKPLQPAAIQFQQKIMNDIQQTHLNKVIQRNKFQVDGVESSGGNRQSRYGKQGKEVREGRDITREKNKEKSDKNDGVDKQVKTQKMEQKQKLKVSAQNRTSHKGKKDDFFIVEEED